jgi:predicted nucleic acid-binding protein
MTADRPKVRAVFDCMVFLQGAARRESPSGACLLLVELAVIELCISEEINLEIQDVLKRPRIRQKSPR